jgi:hypothetical protein
VKKYLNKPDGKEKQMGLTRPKATQLEKPKKKDDPHFWVSLVKSAIRIVACYMLFIGSIEMAAVTLAIAEFAGIGEEIV